MAHLEGRLLDCENRYRRHWKDFVWLWQETKTDWRDQRQKRFEQEYLSRLPSSLGRLSAAVDQLHQALQQAERELRDPHREP